MELYLSAGDVCRLSLLFVSSYPVFDSGIHGFIKSYSLDYRLIVCKKMR